MFDKKTHSTLVMSPTTIKFVKITMLLVFFCFAECAAGNCLKYGHACWGAHGKRSGNRNIPIREDVPNKDIVIPKWFLSKLLQSPVDLRYMHTRNQEPTFKQHPEQLFNGNDADVEAFKGSDVYDSIDEVLSDDDFDDAFRRKEIVSNKHSKILTKRSTKY